MQNRGAMLNSDYPYVSGATMAPTECQVDTSKYVSSVNYYGYVPEDVASIKLELALAPLAMAITADSDAFYFYESGIMKVDEC